MKESLTTTTENWLEDDVLNLDWELPSSPAKTFFIDMSDIVNAGSDPVRVEMRKIHQPLSGKAGWEEMIVSAEALVGMVARDALPQEGQEFYIYYHILNGAPSYNLAKTDGPVKDLDIIDNCYYFTTKEGSWRVKLMAGN